MPQRVPSLNHIRSKNGAAKGVAANNCGGNAPAILSPSNLRLFASVKRQAKVFSWGLDMFD